jgi:hypothetical protein
MKCKTGVSRKADAVKAVLYSRVKVKVPYHRLVKAFRAAGG